MNHLSVGVRLIARDLADHEVYAINAAMATDSDPRLASGYEKARGLFTQVQEGRGYLTAHPDVKLAFAQISMERFGKVMPS